MIIIIVVGKKLLIDENMYALAELGVYDSDIELAREEYR